MLSSPIAIGPCFLLQLTFSYFPSFIIPHVLCCLFSVVCVFGYRFGYRKCLRSSLRQRRQWTIELACLFCWASLARVPLATCTPFPLLCFSLSSGHFLSLFTQSISRPACSLAHADDVLVLFPPATSVQLLPSPDEGSVGLILALWHFLPSLSTTLSPNCLSTHNVCLLAVCNCQLAVLIRLRRCWHCNKVLRFPENLSSFQEKTAVLWCSVNCCFICDGTFLPWRLLASARIDNGHCVFVCVFL